MTQKSKIETKKKKNRRNFRLFSKWEKKGNTYVDSWTSFSFFASFYFNSRINFSDKDVWCNKANCTSKNPKCKTDQECITKIKHWWNNFSYIKLEKSKIFSKKFFFNFYYFCEEIEYWISKYIKCWTSWCNKWSPPPMIIFSA
jgi:hypothetical protein